MLMYGLPRFRKPIPEANATITIRFEGLCDVGQVRLINEQAFDGGPRASRVDALRNPEPSWLFHLSGSVVKEYLRRICDKVANKMRSRSV
jgi:hypothetical protein